MARSLVLVLLGTLLALAPACGLVRRIDTLRAREKALEPDSLVWTFRHLDQLFPVRDIARGPHPAPLAPLPGDSGEADAEETTALPVAPVASRGAGGLRDAPGLDFEAFWHDSHVQGIVVVRGEEVVFERYAGGAGPATRFTTWSVAKSFVATLVANAVHEGRIPSLDVRMDRYATELGQGAYAGVTFRQALQMSSGVAFSERYDDRSTDIFDFLERTLFTNRDAADRVAASYPRGHRPGTHFNYNTAETQVLAHALRAATGEGLSEAMATRLWGPLGMEQGASWALDRDGDDGVEIAGCCLNAALRDWARLGQLYLRGGRAPDGRRVVPAAFVADLGRSQVRHLAPDRAAPGSPWGYATHWWFLPGGAFAARGVYGQYVYVDPEAQIVVALASAWPEPWGEALDAPVREALAMLTRRFGRAQEGAPGLPANAAGSEAP